MGEVLSFLLLIAGIVVGVAVIYQLRRSERLERLKADYRPPPSRTRPKI